MLKSITLFLVVSLLGCSRAACPPKGDFVMPHEGDPTKYVVCREGMELILSCDFGTSYNPLIKRCESFRYWSERAPTCLFNQTETVYFQHETYCSMFYTCAHGVTNLETCPEGLEYNQDLWSCDWPSPNGCFAHTTASPPTESTTEIITDPTTESTTAIITDPTTESTTEIITDPTTESTTEIITDPTTESITEITDPTTESITEIITDPTSESTTEIITDPTTESITEITDPTTESITEIITDPTTESTTEIITEPTYPTEPTVKCPTNGTGITFLPHPTICNMFYMCLAGMPIKLECDFGEEFDIEVVDCVPISDSGCTASKTSTLVWSESTESSYNNNNNNISL